MLRRNIFNASETTLGFFQRHPLNIRVQSEGEHWAARRAAGTPSYCCSLKQNTQLEEGGSSSTWKEELELEQAVQLKKSSRLLVCSCLFSRLQGLTRTAVSPVAFLWHYWFCIIACTLGSSSCQVPEQLGASGAPFHRVTSQPIQVFLHISTSIYFMFQMFCLLFVDQRVAPCLWPVLCAECIWNSFWPLYGLLWCLCLLFHTRSQFWNIKLGTSVIKKTGKEVQENMD